MPRDRRSAPLLQDLFADRQVYVRSGPTSRYVALSRSLQITVATAIGVIVLWLGLASYAAVAKHLQTVEQGRELARLESVAKTLRVTVEDARSVPRVEQKTEPAPDLSAELAEAKAGRDRARTLAAASAAEAEELRRELALAQDQIRMLKSDLTEAEAGRRAVAEQIKFQAGGAADAATGPNTALALAGPGLPDPTCPAR